MPLFIILLLSIIYKKKSKSDSKEKYSYVIQLIKKKVDFVQFDKHFSKMYALFDGYKINKKQAKTIVDRFQQEFIDVANLLIDKHDLRNIHDAKNIKKVSDCNVKRTIRNNLHLFSYAVHMMNESELQKIKKYFLENYVPKEMPEEVEVGNDEVLEDSEYSEDNIFSFPDILCNLFSAEYRKKRYN